MEIMKNNYKLFLAIVIGAVIGSILTHPAGKNQPHGHYQYTLSDIATMTGKPDSTINSNNRNIAASNTNNPGGNEAQMSHNNKAAKKSMAKERGNYRSVTTSPSNTKPVNKKNVRIAGALD